MAKDKKVDRRAKAKPAAKGFNLHDTTSVPLTAESNEEEVLNKPRNFYVTDATQPFTYAFKGRFSLQRTLKIYQTPDDDCWPGGALWDLGVLLSHVLLGVSGIAAATTTTTCSSDVGNKSSQGSHSSSNNKNRSRSISSGNTRFKSKNHDISLPSRNDWENVRTILLSETSVILELGCGVGLTGLVAAAALRPHAVLLTDLAIVIDKVTKRNVEENTELIRHRSKSSASLQSQPTQRLFGKTHCVATPLRWGDETDEHNVAKQIEQFRMTAPVSSPSSTSKRKAKKGLRSDFINSNEADSSSPSTVSTKTGKADVVLIGDVAYQHSPGAPSHFESLHSTLLQFVHEETIVVFGTRIRMPASSDLLTMFLQDLEDMVVPPLTAEEVDPSFAKFKHNMTIHFLRKKKRSDNGEKRSVG